MNDIKHNASGYYDETAFKAIVKADTQPKEVSELINKIKGLSEYAGYTIEERIVLKCKRTGKVYR